MDPVANMLTSIRNAQAAKKDTISVPFSDLNYEIAGILARNNFIGKVDKKGRKSKKFIDIVLKYENDSPRISGLRKISKPGQRIYKRYKELRPVRGGYGMAVVSTPKGLMTNQEARKQKLGGELICEIW